MTLVVGHDAAWGGWGACIAVGETPIAVRHVALSGRRWRWDALAAELVALRQWVEQHQLAADADQVLTVVEHSPTHYSRATRGRATNEAVVNWALGSLAGPILTNAAAWGWRSPWDLDVKTWRSWWGIAGGGSRTATKGAAINMVVSLGWQQHLVEYGWQRGCLSSPTSAAKIAEGPCGDVAEAILIALGASMRLNLAPAGPRRKP